MSGLDGNASVHLSARSSWASRLRTAGVPVYNCAHAIESADHRTGGVSHQMCTAWAYPAPHRMAGRAAGSGAFLCVSKHEDDDWERAEGRPPGHRALARGGASGTL